METEILRQQETTLLDFSAKLHHLYLCVRGIAKIFIPFLFALLLVFSALQVNKTSSVQIEGKRCAVSYILLNICSTFPPSLPHLLLWNIRFSLPQSFWRSVLLPKTIPKIKLDIWHLVIMNEHPRFQFDFGKCSEIWVFIQNRIRQMKNRLEIFPRWTVSETFNLLGLLGRIIFYLGVLNNYQIACVWGLASFIELWASVYSVLCTSSIFK